MNGQNNSGMPPGGKQTDYAGKVIGKYPECGVDEKAFPSLGKCCCRSNTVSETAYEKSCPHCSIWTSLPDRANLEVTMILECQSHGYGRRVKIQ